MRPERLQMPAQGRVVVSTRSAARYSGQTSPCGFLRSRSSPFEYATPRLQGKVVRLLGLMGLGITLMLHPGIASDVDGTPNSIERVLHPSRSTSGGRLTMAQEKVFRVRILLPSLDAIRGLEVDSGCMPMRRRQDGQIEMEAIIPQSTLGKLRRMRRRNVFVEILAGPGLADADREASTMVSRTNRYADGSLPRGLGSRRD